MYTDKFAYSPKSLNKHSSHTQLNKHMRLLTRLFVGEFYIFSSLLTVSMELISLFILNSFTSRKFSKKSKNVSSVSHSNENHEITYEIRRMATKDNIVDEAEFGMNLG